MLAHFLCVKCVFIVVSFLLDNCLGLQYLLVTRFMGSLLIKLVRVFH